MAWSKIKIFWKDTLSGLTATSTDTDPAYDVANLLDWKEGTSWKATSSATQYITFDAGVGNTYTADYLGISGHNLNTVGATLALEYSTDNFAGDINDAFTPYAPGDDLSLVKEFTTQDKRYWRIKISGASAAPDAAIAVWGDAVELDYANTGFDPYAQTKKDTVKKTQGGVVSGIHTMFTERKLRISFGDIDDTLYQKIKDLWDTHGRQNFFIGWDVTDHSSDIYLMMTDGRFSNPFRVGTYRNASLSLTGRAE